MATFGFSVGDFLAALKLVGTIIDALRASGHSSTRYRNLLTELYTLEDALIRVKRLDIADDDDNGSQASERMALQQAAGLCQRSMYEFYKKIEKYQPHLTMRATGGDWLKDGWMKIKWATCRTEDVELFQAELRGHRGSIEILLLTLQLSRSSMQAKAQKQGQRSLAGKIQDLSSEWLGKLAALSGNVASCMEQGKQLVESTTQILRTNIQIFQHIREIQHFITRIPGQVERQQPVYLIDALGKASPFHLEFVRSVEAFTAILKVNFKDTGIGPRMIEMGEFVIQESGSQLEIDLSKPWEMCFSPGQRVAMSMVFFTDFPHFENYCPRCDTLAQGSLEEEIECKTCGMVFCRIKDISAGMAPPMAPLHHEQRVKLYVQSKAKSPQVQPQPQPSSLGKRKRRDGLEDEILNFRRVQIKGIDRARCKLYILRENDSFDRGIGSCHYRYINGLPWLEVEAEHPQERTTEVLYIGKINTSKGYQRQYDKFIIWAEQNGNYMALSFQNSEGCAIIWGVIRAALEVLADPDDSDEIEVEGLFP